MKIVFIVPPEEYFIKSYVTKKLDKGREFRQEILSNVVDGVKRLFDEYRFSSKTFMEASDWHPPHDPFMGIKETVTWHESGCSR